MRWELEEAALLTSAGRSFLCSEVHSENAPLNSAKARIQTILMIKIYSKLVKPFQEVLEGCQVPLATAHHMQSGREIYSLTSQDNAKSIPIHSHMQPRLFS